LNLWGIAGPIMLLQSKPDHQGFIDDFWLKKRLAMGLGVADSCFIHFFLIAIHSAPPPLRIIHL
jgi:hypothetical protein